MSLQAYAISGPHDRQETTPMLDDCRRFRHYENRLNELRHIRLAERPTPDEMREAGWHLDYSRDGYGRLFGRWPEGTDPVPLVPVRDEAA